MKPARNFSTRRVAAASADAAREAARGLAVVADAGGRVARVPG